MNNFCFLKEELPLVFLHSRWTGRTPSSVPVTPCVSEVLSIALRRAPFLLLKLEVVENFRLILNRCDPLSMNELDIRQPSDLD